MSTVFIRILLRYIAAFLIAKGALSPDMGDILASDPDLAVGAQVAAGAMVGAVAEFWYFLANRFGWAK